VLVVGEDSAARQVVTTLRDIPNCAGWFRCCLDEDEVATHGMPSLGDRMATLARTEFVDEVIVAAPFRRDLAQALIRAAQRNHLT